MINDHLVLVNRMNPQMPETLLIHISCSGKRTARASKKPTKMFKRLCVVT